VQLQGGKCDVCGVDFAKYAAMMVYRVQENAREARKNATWRAPLWAQIAFFPFPALITLTLYLVRKAKSR